MWGLWSAYVEVDVAENDSGTIKGYVYRVEGGACYSIEHPAGCSNLKVTDIIFSAARDLRAYR